MAPELPTSRRRIALLVVGTLLAAAIAAPATAALDDGAPTAGSHVTTAETDATLQDGGVYWQGQRLERSAGVAADASLEVRTADTDLLLNQVTADGSGTVVVDTSHLDPGRYYLEDEANDRVATFTVAVQQLAVTADDGELLVQSNRDAFAVTVTADGASGSALVDALPAAETVDTDDDGNAEAARLDVGAGAGLTLDRDGLPADVTLSFSVTDTTASADLAFGEGGADDASDVDDGDGSDQDDDEHGEDDGGDVVRVADGITAGENVEVRTDGTDVLVEQVVADDDGVAVVDTDHLDDGSYYVESEDGDRVATFTVAEGDVAGVGRPGGSGSDGEADPHGDPGAIPPVPDWLWELLADTVGAFR